MEIEKQTATTLKNIENSGRINIKQIASLQQKKALLWAILVFIFVNENNAIKALCKTK